MLNNSNKDLFHFVSLSLNNQARQINFIKIKFDPIDQLNKLTKILFSKIDSDNDYQCELRTKIWKVKNKVSLSILKFNHSELEIDKIVYEIDNSLNFITSLNEELEAVKNCFLAIKNNDRNLKFEEINKIISIRNIDHKIGIFSRIYTNDNLCWSDSDKFKIINLSRKVSFINTKKQLINSFYDKIVIFGPLRYVFSNPIAIELIYGGHASKIDFICYESESLDIPKCPELPINLPFISAPSLDHEEVMISVDDYTDYDANNILERINNILNSTLDSQAANEKIVDAKFVLFTNGSGTLVPSEGRIIELSDYFDGNKEFDEDELHRKRTSELEQDDLILIKTAGGGDYIEVVADDLLIKDNKTELREQALIWKKNVKEALIKKGDPFFKKIFNEFGGKVSSSSYLYEWAGEETMSPQNEKEFRALIQTTASLGYLDVEEPLSFAKDKWHQIEDLKSYHRKAGIVIREQLLMIIKDELDQNHKIISEKKISIPGVEGAEMHLLRIGAIDSHTIRVPYNKLYKLDKPRN